MRKYTPEQKARRQELIRLRRSEWLAAGLCSKCGKNPAGETTYCVGCQQKRKAVDASSSKNRRIKKLAAKVCVNCGNDSKGKRRCDKCFAVTNNNSKQCRIRWRADNKCSCGKPNALDKLHCQECLGKYSDVRITNKIETMTAYGGKCACCGETNILFLTIDHKNGGGKQHRKEILGSSNACGDNFYKWLKKNNWPKDEFQCLCLQCNCGRSVNGGVCPHKDMVRPYGLKTIDLVSLPIGQTNKPGKISGALSIKVRAIMAYGSNCSCCGEEDIRFLTIDHINGDGNTHRLDILGSKSAAGARFYYWLSRNDWPVGHQVLCFQCNGGKHTNKGICPHKLGIPKCDSVISTKLS